MRLVVDDTFNRIQKLILSRTVTTTLFFCGNSVDCMRSRSGFRALRAAVLRPGGPCLGVRENEQEGACEPHAEK